MHPIKCKTCTRYIPEYLAHTHVITRGNTDYEVKICIYCKRARDKGWILIRKFNRWINPDVIDAIVEKSVTGIKPNKLTLAEITKPLAAFGYEKKGGIVLPKKKKVVQMTNKEKKRVTEMIGKQRFNTAISRKVGPRKTDTWLNWDAYDYKDDDLSTLLG